MKNYADYIKADPFRRALHFPTVEEVLGDLNNKRILDIGCGDGLFPRLLAERGASVVGYDMAPQKIAEAQAQEDAQRLDATFVVATPHTFFARRHVRCSNVGHGATVCDIARGAGSLFPLRIAPPRVRRTIYLCRPQSFVLGFWTGFRGPPIHQAGLQ